MATSTSNLGLTLPSVNDAADIAVLNSNFQKIDGKIPAAGAAPSGYGLGEYAKHVSSAEIDRTVLNGFYQLSNSITVDGVALYYHRMVVIAGDEKNLIQELYSIVGNNKLRRQCENSVWQPWEWVNPPMQLGVEYRTTERYWGKPVYCKLVNCGALPDTTEKLVYYADNGVVNHIVRYSGEMFASGDTFSMPYTLNGVEVCVQAISRTGINLYASYNASGFEAYVTVWYIKN